MHPGRTGHRHSEFHAHLPQRGRIGPNLNDSWCGAAIQLNYTATKRSSSIPSVLTRKTLWGAVNVRPHATTLLMAPHSQLCLQYSGQVHFMHMDLPDKKETAEIKTLLSGGTSRFFHYRHIWALFQDRKWKQVHRLTNRPLL